MKKLSLLVLALFMLAIVAGCGEASNGNGDTNGNGELQWMAYAFDQVIKPASGSSGKIKSFVIKQTNLEGTGEFRIEGTYLGKVTTSIKTNKYAMNFNFEDFDPEDYDFENLEPELVENSVECYAIKHLITAVDDPDRTEWWVEATIYVPVAELGETYTGMIFAKANIENSDESTAEFGYYLTAAMKAEQDTVTYVPYMDEIEALGDEDVFFVGFYSWSWMWFQPFTASGTRYLEEQSWNLGGYSYEVSKVNKTIGSYTFNAWSIEVNWTDGTASGTYKAICAPDLALPIYLEIGAHDSDDDDIDGNFAYELISLTLQ